MPRELRQLRKLFQFWTLLYALGALLFFFFPENVVATLNLSSKYLFFLNSMDANPSHFWLALAVSMMSVITYLSYSIVKNIEQSADMIRAILISKAVSTLGFLYFFLRNGHPAPLFWGAWCDGSIFALTFYFYKQAKLK